MTTSSSSPSRPRPVTAKDVAERAGVARPTVSIVLNGAKSGTVVSDATRQRVIQAAQELRYRPNLSARAMKSGKSRQIGVLVRNNSRVAPHEVGAHPLAYEFVLGISEGLEEAGYMMSFVRASDIDETKHTQRSAFQGHLLDGVIVVSDVPAVPDEQLETMVPHCVWLDSSVWHDFNCMRRDESHAGRLAMEKILEHGYRDVFCLQPAPTSDGIAMHYSLQARLSGLTSAAQTVGVAARHWELAEGNSAPLFADLISQLTPQTAVLATTYYAAHQFSRALLRAGVRPGIDFALAACENGFAASSAGFSGLDCVQFDRFRMGRSAAQMMLRLLADDDSSPCLSELITDSWCEGDTLPPCPTEI